MIPLGSDPFGTILDRFSLLGSGFFLSFLAEKAWQNSGKRGNLQAN
jgi:hypothetical protein